VTRCRSLDTQAGARHDTIERRCSWQTWQY
jgi:hypothetical protein